MLARIPATTYHRDTRVGGGNAFGGITRYCMGVLCAAVRRVCAVRRYEHLVYSLGLVGISRCALSMSEVRQSLAITSGGILGRAAPLFELRAFTL
jgi:hypothetical protein